MIVAKVIEIFRKPSNKIYGYRIKDINTGEVKDVEPYKLKCAIKNKKIVLSNYRLTKDNRLVKSASNFKPDTKGTYYLMNKDKVALEFDIDYGTSKKIGRLPYNFISIADWIEKRARFSCARDVKKFFSSIGIDNSKQFIEIIHCVSLNDTFWIKRKESKLKWKNVSPFRNNYSNVISTYGLDGINIGKNGKSYFSPVVSTDGSFPHTWKFGVGNIKFIKASSKYTIGGTNSGREPFSEYYASVAADYLHFNHVKYKIRKHIRYDKKVDVVTECDCYTNESMGSVTANDLGLRSYEEVLAYSKKLCANAYKTCVDMYFLDCLLLNTDRHLSNIEFYINNATQEVIDMVPIFDNNCALLPRFIEGYEEFNRNEYLVRDGRAFENLYRLVKENKSYKSELISLKNFRFTKPENVDIRNERIGFLNKLLQMQVAYLLRL